MPTPNVPALKKLAAWLKRANRTQTWLAEKLHVYPSTVSAWFRRVTRPEEHLRAAIQVISAGAVAVPDWRSLTEQKFVDRISKEAT